MSTTTVAGRFVAVMMGMSLAAAAVAQVSPEATYPTPAPEAAYPSPAAQPPLAQMPAAPVPAYQVPGAPLPNGAIPGAMPNGPMMNGILQPLGQPAAPSRVRNAFAATLGAILNNAASAGTLGLSQLVTGSITAWFNRKGNRLAGQPYGAGMPGYGQAYPATDPYAAAGGQYPQQGYPTQQAYPTTTYPNQQYPTTAPSPYPGQQTYATQSAYPTQQTTPGQPGYATQPTQPYTTTPQGGTYPTNPTYGTAPAYPTTQPYTTSQPGTYPAAQSGTYAGGAPSATYGAQGYDATSYYDPQTGQPAQAMAYSTAAITSVTDIYAGIAYEVHAVRPAVGDSVPVSPATYEFHTGDRFLVYYRPSMPGRMEVYNVNPLGQTTLIDAVNMAAGQLSTLGPYEFAANKGDESLRIVLSPCSTPQLLTASRDIINVNNTLQAGAPGGGVQLGSCSGLNTRGVARGDQAHAGKTGGGVRTRDIRNVALDGGTSFALDPVSRQELTSGSVAPREVTIVFHHR